MVWCGQDLAVFWEKKTSGGSSSGSASRWPSARRPPRSGRTLRAPRRRRPPHPPSRRRGRKQHTRAYHRGGNIKCRRPCLGRLRLGEALVAAGGGNRCPEITLRQQGQPQWSDRVRLVRTSDAAKSLFSESTAFGGSIQDPESRPPVSRAHNRIQGPGSAIQDPGSRSPASRIQDPGSRV